MCTEVIRWHWKGRAEERQAGKRSSPRREQSSTAQGTRPHTALADEGCEAEDWFTGERLQKEDGAFALPLEGYRWRIVRFRPSAAGKEAKGSSTDVVECRYPMYVPWATEVEVEPVGGGRPYMTFVKHGNIVIRGRPGERFRCKWHDLNGTPDQMEVELK